MAAPTVAEFREQLPEFPTDTDDAAIERAIGVARQIHDVSKTATIYLAAHMLTVAPSGADDAAGEDEVASEQIGPLRVSFGSQARTADERYYTRTEYGRTYLVLSQHVPSVAIAARVVG